MPACGLFIRVSHAQYHGLVEGATGQLQADGTASLVKSAGQR